MKKKFVSIVLTVMLAASLMTGCGNKAKAPAASAPAVETKAEVTPESKAAPESDVALGTEEESEIEPVDNDGAEDFTLLDVSTDMIQTGVYAVSEGGTELVFSMFTEPSGTSMASLFVFPTEGEADVICGVYTAESEIDEDGIAWTLLTVTDVYTGDEFEIGFGELDETVYIFDVALNPYEGQYLTADETINYMGVAAALLEEQ